MATRENPPVTLHVDLSDTGVTAVAMATANVELHVAILGTQRTQERELASELSKMKEIK